MRKYVFLVGCLLGMILTMFPVQAQEKITPLLVTDEARCQQWVDSVMSHLSLQEKIGQLLVPRVPARSGCASIRLAVCCLPKEP